MDEYYSDQSEMPHYSSYSRQRGSGIGALVRGVGGIALPLAKKYIIPTAAKLGREFLKETLLELPDIVSKKKSPKKALRDTVKRTIKKQVGAGRRRRVSKRKTHKQKSRPSDKSRSHKRKAFNKIG